MPRILVTGGCGFIGSHIVEELLLENYEVIVIDNLSTGKRSNIEEDRVQLYISDICSKEYREIVKITKPDAIIHQAAQVSVTDSIENILNDGETNIKGTLNVIESAKENGVKKIIFASSAAVYGNPLFLPISINHPIQPISPYGLSKYTVEQYLKMSKSLYGIDFTILRYSNVYGPKQVVLSEGGVVSIFFNKILKNESPLIYGDGKQTRDFIYVKDVAKANINSIHKGNNKIFNISSSKEISINDLYFKIKELLNSGLNPIYKEERLGDIKHSLLDNRSAINDLEWKPYHSINEGLKNTFEYINRNIEKE